MVSPIEGIYIFNFPTAICCGCPEGETTIHWGQKSQIYSSLTNLPLRATAASLAKQASRTELFILSVRQGMHASRLRRDPETSGRARARSPASDDRPRRSRHRCDQMY